MEYRVKVQKKLMIAVSTILVISFLLLNLFSYFESVKILVEEMDRHMEAQADSFSHQLSSYWQERENALLAEALSISDISEERSVVEKYLKNQYAFLKKEYGIENYYVIYPDETMQMIHDGGFRLQGAEKRATALETARSKKNATVYTRAFLEEGKAVIGLLRAVVNADNKVEAVVGMDIPISDLATLLQTTSLGKRGYAFLVDREGRFLVHPKYIFQEDGDNIMTVSEGSLRGLWEMLLNGSEAMQSFQYQKREKVFYPRILRGPEGFLVCETDREEILVRQRIVLAQNIIIFFLGFVAILFVISMMMGKIIGPITRLSNHMAIMAAGDLCSEVEPLKSGDELQQLSESVTSLQESVKKLLTEAQKNSELLSSFSGNILEIGQHEKEMANQAEAKMRQALAVHETMEEIQGRTLQAAEQMQIPVQTAQEQITRMKEDLHTMQELQNQIQMKTNLLIEQGGIIESEKNLLMSENSFAVEHIAKMKIEIDAMSGLTKETELLSERAVKEVEYAEKLRQNLATTAAYLTKLAMESGQAVSGMQHRISELKNSAEVTLHALSRLQDVQVQSGDTLKAADTMVGQLSAGLADAKAKTEILLPAIETLRHQREIVSSVQSNLGGTLEENRDALFEAKESTLKVAAGMEMLEQETKDLAEMAEKFEEISQFFHLKK